MTEEKKFDRNAKKAVVYMSDEAGIIQPVLAHAKNAMLEHGWGLSSLKEYLEPREEIKAAAKKAKKSGKPKAPADPKKDKETAKEGDYTLRESVEKCGSNAALEAIVEGEKITVDGWGDMKFTARKEAVLALVDAAEEAGADKKADAE